MAQACEDAGVSPYKMRKFINDGQIWSRPSGTILSKKQVRCLETGVIYRSIAESARAHKVQPTQMSAHIAGRIKSIGGFHFELTGDFTPPEPPRRKSRRKSVPPDTIPVRDDKGREYRGVNHLAHETGLKRRAVVERLRLDPEGIWRTAWIEGFRTARHDGKLWWINGSIPVDTFRKFQTALRFTGKRVTAGEARKMTGDLFK